MELPRPKQITDKLRRSATTGRAKTQRIKTSGGGEDDGGRITLWATISASSRGRRGGGGLLKPNRGRWRPTREDPEGK